jgi:RNA polymerase II subunit A small phosphatase-like protein
MNFCPSCDDVTITSGKGLLEPEMLHALMQNRKAVDMTTEDDKHIALDSRHGSLSSPTATVPGLTVSGQKRCRDDDDDDDDDASVDSISQQECKVLKGLEDDSITAVEILSNLLESENANPGNEESDDDDISLACSPPTLLEEQLPGDRGKKCLVLDMDETLLHTSVLCTNGDPETGVQVQLEGELGTVYVTKRPGVDQFLAEMAKHYEVIVFTAGTQEYADRLLDLLDPTKTLIRTRLFRQSCLSFGDNIFVKDLSLLGRDLSQTIIVDNSPLSYAFHKNNAIDCSSFFDDENDRELDQIGAFLAAIKDVKDVRELLRHWRTWPKLAPSLDEHGDEQEMAENSVAVSVAAQ